jgi:hypothetical protein
VTGRPRPIGSERQHSIAAAVEEEKSFTPTDGKTARIDNAAVIAELAEKTSLTVKGQERAESVAICPGCAGYEERHHRDVLLTYAAPRRLR